MNIPLYLKHLCASVIIIKKPIDYLHKGFLSPNIKHFPELIDHTYD